MWFLAASALVLVGVGFYIMPDDWDKGILLVFFSSILLALAIVVALLGRAQEGSITQRSDRPD